MLLQTSQSITVTQYQSDTPMQQYSCFYLINPILHLQVSIGIDSLNPSSGIDNKLSGLQRNLWGRLVWPFLLSSS